MNSKLISLLTICRKAGRLVMGFDPAKEALAEGKAKLVLLAENISPKTEKEINFFAAKINVPVMRSGCTQEDFFNGIGKKVGIVTICDEGFSKKAAVLANEPQEK